MTRCWNICNGSCFVLGSEAGAPLARLAELSALTLTWPLQLDLDPERICPRAYITEVHTYIISSIEARHGGVYYRYVA